MITISTNSALISSCNIIYVLNIFNSMHRQLIFLGLWSRKLIPKLILLSPKAKKQITFTTQRSEQFLFNQNYIKEKTKETQSPQKNSQKNIDLLLRILDLLIIDPKRSLFKTNKTRSTTIKNNNDQSGGDDGHWQALARGGADGGDRRHNTLEGERKWLELLHMAEKHIKNTKKTRKKHVEVEGEKKKGERVRGERTPSSPPRARVLLAAIFWQRCSCQDHTNSPIFCVFSLFVKKKETYK